MIRFQVTPLRTEGQLLLPVGEGQVIASDACHVRQALVDACNARSWAVHRRSRELTKHVASETLPYEVVYTVGGQMLLALWRLS